MKSAPENLNSEPRFELTLRNFPNVEARLEACRLIYNSSDRNLVAALSSTPYVVGRSFFGGEQERIHEALKELGIAHSFLGKPPHEDLKIEYDLSSKSTASLETRAEEAVNKTNLVRKGLSKKISLKLWGTLTVSLVLVGTFFYLSQSDFTATKESAGKILSTGTRKSPPQYHGEARLEKVNPKVQFRKNNELAWESAYVGQELNSQDSIRTFDHANAILFYKDGTRVNLKENTLLVVGEKLDLSEKEIELKNGSLQTRIPSNSSLKELRIKTQQGVVRVKKSDEESSTQVNTSIDGSKLQVQVASGKASFHQTGSENEEAVELAQDEQITANNNSPIIRQTYERKIQLMTPQKDAREVLSQDSSRNLRFEWEWIGADTYEIYFGTDSQLSKPFLVRNLEQNFLELSYLDPGEIYWQIQSTIDGVIFKSEIRRLYVQQHGH